jgi:hypothetical protein
VPGAPAVPEATIIQPTCATPTGTITVTAPLGATLEYSKDGTTWQSSVVFASLTANASYTIRVRNTATDPSCIASSVFALNSVPAGLPAPVATVTQQPTCNLTTGTITITSPASGSGNTFSIDGVNYVNTDGIFSDLLPGVYNVTVMNAAGCISSATQLTVLQPEGKPAQPANFNVYIETICRGSSAKYGVPNDPSVTYMWNYTGTGVTMVQNNNTVNMTFSETSTTGVLSVVAVNGCGSSVAREMTITVRPLPSPAGTISGPSVACPGMNGVVYSVPVILNASSYIWTVPDGVNITGGAGTNEITVDFSGTFVSGVFTVQGRKSCGTGLVSPELHVTSGMKPVQPGEFIEYETTVCRGGSAIYSVPDDPTVTYSWTYSGQGAKITANSGKGDITSIDAKCNTHSVVVSFSDAATSGILSVVAVNGCGSSAPRSISITVRELPGDAGRVEGPNVICQGAKGIVYTVPIIPNATGYVWKVPSGASIVKGENTNSVTVDYSSNALSGVITVQGIKSCGTGKISPELYVTVNPTPPTPVIELSGNTLSSSVLNGNQWYLNNEPVKDANGGTLVAAVNGLYFNIITQNGCDSPKSNILDVKLPDTKSALSESDIEIYPVPSKGKFTATVNTGSDELVDIVVFSSSGIKIFEKKNVAITGVTQVPFDLGTVPAGIYYIRFISKKGTVIKTMIMSK